MHPSANCCGFQFWVINKCQRVKLWNETSHRYRISEPKAHSCTLADCTTQNFTSCLGPSTLTLDYLWLETFCLDWRVSFPIVSSEWMCTGMETTSWIHWPCMSAGDFSNWWRLCNGVGHQQLGWYATFDTSRYDSDRWHVRKHSGWSSVSIRVHCAFRWTWVIRAGQCDTPHVQNCYREASGTFFWV